jgi:hypothetical protein
VLIQATVGYLAKEAESKKLQATFLFNSQQSPVQQPFHEKATAGTGMFIVAYW